MMKPSKVVACVGGVVSASVLLLLSGVTGSFVEDVTSVGISSQNSQAYVSMLLNSNTSYNESGFVPKTVSGSATTYFCDYAYLYASMVAYCFQNIYVSIPF